MLYDLIPYLLPYLSPNPYPLYPLLVPFTLVSTLPYPPIHLAGASSQQQAVDEEALEQLAEHAQGIMLG